MEIYELMRQQQLRIAVIGVGYVGLPLVMAFAEHYPVIGYDVDEDRIARYRRLREEQDEPIRRNLTFTTDADELLAAHVYIVTVPTPVDRGNKPDLTFLEAASRQVGSCLQRGNLVIYESTVYPGVTEEHCIPLLEEVSGLRCGRDFKTGYSPERINPGDPHHRLSNTTKVVAGCDEEALAMVSSLYEQIIEAGVYRAPSIVTAEAAKVVENAQRDMNIAFMNELAMMFHQMGIDTKSVLAASATKWNFVPVSPGLVGGHCIGVDTYYLIHGARKSGFHPLMLLGARHINEGMGSYIANETIKQLVRLHVADSDGLKIAILGVTYKENTDDLRNSQVKAIIEELQEYGVSLSAADPQADPQEAAGFLNLELVDLDSISDVHAVIMAVPHDAYRNLSLDDLERLYGDSQTRLLIDVKGIYDPQELEQRQIHYWRL